jgi:uracil phosphoribosyltransferase
VVIAAPEGTASRKARITIILVVSIDEKLDKHSYIVPGCDAGDLAYGNKL